MGNQEEDEDSLNAAQNEQSMGEIVSMQSPTANANNRIDDFNEV